ncbi:MAG: MBL fold metallo-hydrolase [Acidocella sp. 20-57-95]|nr:MAG: MBL fold metallo-hydrolase [Acidocella sp. 20-57-95]HQT64493.1 MBL fold metallo-hydrolase [Acidocella sp.]
MKVTLLGVGGSAGSPQIGGADGLGDWGELDPTEPRNRRTRPSIVIEGPEGKRLLVDTGPDLRIQLTNCGVPNVHAVLYTHAHADHIAGLDEIRILNRLINAPMPIYATAAVFGEIRQRFDYAFKPWNGNGFFRPVLAPQNIEAGQVMDILGLPVQVFEQDHGYISSLGVRVGSFAYCTDVVRLDDAALNALAGVEILVVDCFTKTTPHPTHANLEQVLAWVERVKPTLTILTHMGPTMDYRSLLKDLPKGVEPGFDGMVVDLTYF